MRNCLKTQLKEIVDNNSLSYLGEIRIHNSYDANASRLTNCFTLRCNDTITIKSVDGSNSVALLNDSNDGIDWGITPFVPEITIPASPSEDKMVGIANSDCTIVIIDKNAVRRIAGFSYDQRRNFVFTDITQLACATSLTSLNITAKVNGILRYNPSIAVSLETIRFGDVEWSGNTGGIDFDYMPLKNFDIIHVDTSASKGSVSGFLQRLVNGGNSLPNTLVVCRTNCGGTVEECVEAVHAAGVTSYNIGCCSKMTCKGRACEDTTYKIVNADANTYAVSWGSTPEGTYNVSTHTWE